MIFGDVSARETWILLKKSIDDVSSKDGVNIVVHWSPINKENGKLNIEQGIYYVSG